MLQFVCENAVVLTIVVALTSMTVRLDYALLEAKFAVCVLNACVSCSSGYTPQQHDGRYGRVPLGEHFDRRPGRVRLAPQRPKGCEFSLGRGTGWPSLRPGRSSAV